MFYGSSLEYAELSYGDRLVLFCGNHKTNTTVLILLGIISYFLLGFIVVSKKCGLKLDHFKTELGGYDVTMIITCFALMCIWPVGLFVKN